jgi:hypothetical protein
MPTRRTNGTEWAPRERPRFERNGAAAAGAAATPAAKRRTPAARPAVVAEPPRREPPPAPVARPRNPHRNIIILGLLALVCVVAGAGAALISDNGNNGGKATAGPRATASRSQGAPTGGVQRASASEQPSTTASTTTPAPTATTTTPGTTDGGASRSPTALNNAGFAMLPSDPQGALPLLQKAVDGFRAASDRSSIDYAYSLYNLGWALDLAGRPGEAIPYLQERLAVSDYKRGVVEAELKQAQAAAGGSATADAGSGDAAGPGKAKGHGKAKGRAGD